MSILNQNMPSPNYSAPQKSKATKWLWIFIIVIIVAIVAIVVYAYFKNKNQTSEAESSQSKSDSSQYNWSTMKEGPYNDSISYATSTDLLKWTDQQTVLAEHASVPDVIVKDDVIYVYFVDVSVDGKPEQISLIKSSDKGKTWTQKQNITIEGVGDRVAVDPDPMLLSDGKIRLYYFDIATTKNDLSLEKNTMYSAISDDGISFTQEDGIRLNYTGIFDPDVLKIGDNWTMYVGTDDQKVLYATSTDGLNFVYGGVAYSGGAIPNVYYAGEKYYMYVGGIDILTSNNGKTFTKTSSGFESVNKTTADPGVVKISDNNYLMIYKTKVVFTTQPQ
jgi:hypothetical protein